MKTEPAAVWMQIDNLVPWDRNPRDNDHAVPGVADSIRRFGFASPIIARKSGDKHEVIAGHTRLKAAKTLGLDRVPVRVMELDPADAKLLALADNKVAEAADWSDDLGPLLRELQEEGLEIDGLGWGDDELEELLAEPAVDIDGSEDDVPEMTDDVDSEPGKVYELGPHKLACGDCTDPQTWAQLMGEEKLKCVWTDPPYGIAYVGKTKDALTIENDALSAAETADLWRAAFEQLKNVCEPGAAWYAAAPAGPIFWRLGEVLEEYNWKRTLVWVKDRFVMGRGDYHYRHEPVFHGWFDGAARLCPVPRNVDSIFEVKRPGASKEHPTMKPVELVVSMLDNSSKPSWLVGEPFGGSGTTLIACATTGRVARVVELDPKYCDVIRRRWTRWAKEHNRDPGPGALDG